MIKSDESGIKLFSPNILDTISILCKTIQIVVDEKWKT